MRIIQRMSVGALRRWLPLEADELIATALRRAGRERFADASFRGALDRLLEALAAQAHLGVFGHIAARFDLLRCMHNVLRMDQAEEQDPGILARCIGRPIFITGLPRSGTTFLHSLLALDPANVAPLSWQLIYPYPRREAWLPGDHRRAHVARQLALFRLIAPGLSHMHPLRADAPQECTDITAHVFRSLRLDTIYHIPAYRDWVDADGHEPAYRFHRRFLQHLDAQGLPGRQWVLKSPDHVFALDALRRTYPQAHIVMLHRDPLKVLASVAKLTELLRRPFTSRLERAQIGQEVSARWAEGAERMIAARAAVHDILHLYYRDIVVAPLHTVARLYRHCGLTLSPVAEQRMQEYVHRAPRGGYGVHEHSLAQFGLEPRLLRGQFARYVNTFDVPAERLREPARGVFTARPV
jgi:hypothetical protein